MMNSPEPLEPHHVPEPEDPEAADSAGLFPSTATDSCFFEGIVISTGNTTWSDSRIIYVNDAMCQTCGCTSKDLLGQTPGDLLGEQIRADFLRSVNKAHSEGNSFQGKLANLLGHHNELDLQITPLPDAAGNPTHFVSVYRDVNRHMQNENDWREFSNRFQALSLATSVVVFCVNADWTTMRYLLGKGFLSNSPQPIAHWMEKYLLAEEQGLVRERIQQAIQNHSIFELEHHVIQQDGTTGWTLSRAIPIKNEQGEVLEWFGTATDITRQKQVESQLRERKEWLRAVLNTATDAIINIDKRGIITNVNPATVKMFGYQEQELIGQNVKMLMPQPFSNEHDQYLARYHNTGVRRIIGTSHDVRGKRKDGSVFPISLSVSEVDHLGFFTGIVHDLSERESLQRDVLAATEAEQRRIGQDLHDSIQQSLAGLSMLAANLVHQLESQPENHSVSVQEKCRLLASKIVDGISRTHQEVREIAHGLVPVRLDPDGLVEALRELARQTDELEGISCALKHDDQITVREGLTATHLYRIAQEAVSNAIKHAQPEHILISLESTGGQWLLQVANDGNGFDGSSSQAGLGLKTMRFRASVIGATLTISPVKTGGTLVSCRLNQEERIRHGQQD